MTTLRRVAPAIALFFLSPLVAEFLLGNISISALAVVLGLAPLYGGGAILVREVARRTGRSWPTILLLAFAYSLVEEGLVIQTLFNPSYLGLDLLRWAPIPGLGMGGWWTVFVLTLHTVWSIAVPIALVETFTARRSTEPWLGRIGLAVTGVLFALGALAFFAGTYAEERFMASGPQLLGTAVVVVAVIVAAFAVGRDSGPVDDRPAPEPWRVGVVALVAASAFKAGIYVPGWLSLAGWIALFAAMAALVTQWSRREGWGSPHRLALAGGALLAYAAYAFPQRPVVGATGAVDLIGNAVFALGAVILVMAAARVVRSTPPHEGVSASAGRGAMLKT